MPPRKKISFLKRSVDQDEKNNLSNSQQIKMKDTQYEINRVINLLIKELFKISEIEEGTEMKETDLEIDVKKVNVHIIHQVVILIAGSDMHKGKNKSKKER